MKKRKTSLSVQGGILAAAAVLCAGINFLYRILVMNRIGEPGMGYYSSAFGIYSVLVILSSYSLPLAVSKLVSARITVKEYKNAYSVFLTALLIGIAGGLLSGILIYFGSGFYASGILKRPMTVYALRALAPAAAFSVVLGILRGYFQGMGTAIPTGISLAVEHGITAIAGVILSFSLYRSGIASGIVYGKEDFPGAFGAAGGILGSSLGAFAAIVFLGFLYTVYKRVMHKKIRKDPTKVTESYFEFSRDFLIAAVPAVLGILAYQVSLLIDDALFGQMMSFLKVSSIEAAALWGEYGKYQLLIFFPVVLACAGGILKTGTVSRLDKELDRGLIGERLESGIRFGMMTAIPFAVGLTVLSRPLMHFFFRTDSVKAANVLLVGASAVVFFVLAFITSEVLFSLDYGNIAVRNGVYSLVIHIVMLVLALILFKGSIYGVVLSNLFFGGLVFLFNRITLRHKVKYGQELKKTYLLPLAASAVMGGIMAVVYYLIYKAVSLNGLGVMLSVLLGTISYLVLILKLKCIEEYELLGVPGGRWLIRAGKKVHLL